MNEINRLSYVLCMMRESNKRSMKRREVKKEEEIEEIERLFYLKLAEAGSMMRMEK